MNSATYTVSQKKLDPFHLSITLANAAHFNHFFTVADKVYNKIYHRTSNLLVHYLVK